MRTTVTLDEHEDGVLTIPDEIMRKLGWKEGDDVTVEVVKGQIVVSKVPSEP